MHKIAIVKSLKLLVLSAMMLCWPSAALAEITLSFHSFNGSVLFGRYPHAFIVMKGTAEDGTAINENYGFSAKTISTRVLSGPVEHVVMSEKESYIAKTNRHFSVTIDDEKYDEIVALMVQWRDAPGKYYDLSNRNCIHFVGAVAQTVGVQVEYPKNMRRRPKKWLNHIIGLNPQLNAKPIR